MSKIKGKWALVTSASSGLGTDFATILAEHDAMWWWQGAKSVSKHWPILSKTSTGSRPALSPKT